VAVPVLLLVLEDAKYWMTLLRIGMILVLALLPLVYKNLLIPLTARIKVWL
jgi:hypothetical protein